MRRSFWIFAGIVAHMPMSAFAQTGDARLDFEDTLVVTAERRATPASDAPTDITRLDRETLSFISADHVSEALARAPGVALHRGSGAEHLTAIRSPVLTGGAGAGSFLFLENGVPIRSPGFANVNGLFDAHYEIADAIEIVRGPSGALYGANAIHGVINVFTPAPAEDFSANVEIFGDSEDRYKWRGAVSGARGAHSLLVGASVTSEAGYRRDAGLDQQKLTARHIYRGAGWSADTIFSFHNLEQETAGFIFGADTLRDRERRRDNAFPDAYRDAKSARLQSTIEIEKSAETSIRITPYARWHEMGFPQHFLPSNALETNSHWGAGVQSGVYHEAGPLSLIAGVDAEIASGELREFQSAPTIFSFTQGLHYDYDVDAFYGSAFAQGRYAFSPRTSLTAAIRVDGAIYDYTNNTDTGIVGRFLRIDDTVDRFLTASPKVSVRHEFSERASGYVSFARGARPPQTTDLYRLQINQTGDRARPEIIDALEAGMSVGDDDKVRLALTGFYMNKRNFFFRDADGFNVTNGKTRHVGVEADVTIKLADTVSLQSAITYAAHTYRFDRPVGRASEAISFGDDIDSAPRVIANTRAAWRPVDRLRLEAEWVFLGSYFTDAANDHSYDGHNLLHLRAEAGVSDQLSIFLSIRNVTDALYAERADFAFGNDRFFPGEERTVGVGLRGSL